MEGKLASHFTPQPYVFDPKHKRAFDLEVETGKKRNAADRISWVDTEEVAALVIDNGYAFLGPSPASALLCPPLCHCKCLRWLPRCGSIEDEGLNGLG